MKTIRRTVSAPVNVGLNQLPEEYAPWNSIRDGYNMIPWEGGLRTRWAQIPSYTVSPTHPNYAIVEMDADNHHLVEAYITEEADGNKINCVLDGSTVRTVLVYNANSYESYLFDKISVMHLTDKIAICALGYFYATRDDVEQCYLAFVKVNDNYPPQSFFSLTTGTPTTPDVVPDAGLTFQLYAGRVLILNTEILYLSSTIRVMDSGFVEFSFNEFNTPALNTDTISADLDMKITHAVVWNESLIISGTNRQYSVLGSTPETITIKPIGDKSARLLFTMDRDLFLVSGNSIYVASQVTSEYFIKWHNITTTLPNLDFDDDVQFFPLPFEDAGCLTGLYTLDALWFKRSGDSFVFAYLRLHPNHDDTSLGLREFLGHRYVAHDGLTVLDLTYEHSVDKGSILYPIRSKVYFNKFVPRDTSGGVVSYDRLRIRDIFIVFDIIPYTRTAIKISNGYQSAFSEGFADTSLKLTVNDGPTSYSIDYSTTAGASLYTTDNTRLNLKTIGYSYFMSKRR